MGNGQSASQPDEHGGKQPPLDAPRQQERDPSSGRTAEKAGNLEGQFSFKALLGAIVVTLTLAFGAVGAGFSPPRVIVILCFAVIFSATALPAFRGYLMLRKRTTDKRSALMLTTCVLSAAVMVATFTFWPFGSTAKVGNPLVGFAAQNSCNLAKLNPPPPVTPSMAKVPLMYAIRSTDSVAGDHTAVAHSVFADGWMQQVFLATGNHVADASAVVSLNLPSFKPFPVKFEILTTAGTVIGSATATYDGKTNNAELHARFAVPVPVRQGSLYALRVTNESALATGSGFTIAIYAHVLNNDPMLNAPYAIPACAHGTGDGGANSVPILDNDDSYQVLSGSIWATSPS
jgi:hypothetical protein